LSFFVLYQSSLRRVQPEVERKTFLPYMQAKDGLDQFLRLHLSYRLLL
jgi:hypothetical protein